jgi:hypothetical protein
MSDIFISYKREEQPAARKLANALESEGWSVWWDPKLRAGEHFDDVIEKALNEAKCVIVLWSKRSVVSQYVRDEATYALRRNKLVPVMIEEVEIPFRFEGLHTPSLLDWDSSIDFSEFRRLVADIAAIVVGLPPTEAKRKADKEEEGNRAQREAEQRRLQAEAQRLRQQERQRSEKETKRKAEEDNQRRIEEEKKLLQEAERRRRDPKEQRQAEAERLREQGQQRSEEEARRKTNEGKEENRAKRTDVVLELGNVFLSYSREDNTYVKKLLDYLRTQGLSVWADDRIDYGDRWWKTIVTCIRNCVAVVVVMTPSSEESKWVEREILLADEEQKPIFPLLLKGKRFPLLIGVQYHDVTNGEVPPLTFVSTLKRLAAS